MSRFEFYLEAVDEGTHMGYEKDPEIFAKDKAKAKEAEDTAIDAIVNTIKGKVEVGDGEGEEPKTETKSDANVKAEITKKIKKPGTYAKAFIRLYKSGKKEFRYTDIVRALLYVVTNGRTEYKSDWHRGIGAQNLCYNQGPGLLRLNFDKLPNGKYKFKESKLQSLEDGSIQPFKGKAENSLFSKKM